MIKVVHTLGLGCWGGGGRWVGGGFVVFGCFVDIKEGLAGGGVGFVWTLAVGAFESCVRAVLSSCMVGRADMVACIVFPSTELTSDLCSANCRVVSKALAGIALAVGLGVSVCSTSGLYCSNKLAVLDNSIYIVLYLETKLN